MGRGFPAQRDLGAVDAKHQGIAAGSAPDRCNRCPRHETKFHQALAGFFGKIEALDRTLFAPCQIQQAVGTGPAAVTMPAPVLLVETNLQHDFSMTTPNAPVKTWAGG